jgi:hypothetical protein
MDEQRIPDAAIMAAAQHGAAVALDYLFNSASDPDEDWPEWNPFENRHDSWAGEMLEDHEYVSWPDYVTEAEAWDRMNGVLTTVMHGAYVATLRALP